MQDVLRGYRENYGPEFVDELIDAFLVDTQQRLDAIRGEIVKADPQMVMRESHGLKSSCGNMGAREMAALCLQLEMAGREDRLHEAPALFERLEAEFQRVTPLLEQERTVSG